MSTYIGNILDKEISSRIRTSYWSHDEWQNTWLEWIPYRSLQRVMSCVGLPLLWEAKKSFKNKKFNPTNNFGSHILDWRPLIMPFQIIAKKVLTLCLSPLLDHIIRLE